MIDSIVALDAGVISLEAARPRMEVLDDLHEVGFQRGVGPGVYSSHSPRVPPIEEVERSLRAGPAERLWVDPDCGSKTRGYPEVEAVLRDITTAVARVRAELE